MPSTVDTRPFRLGDDLATTAGHVVHRTDVFELIQYEAQTETVATRPLVAIPPQINKYYITDLAPDRSLVEHMVRAGFPYFRDELAQPDRRPSRLEPRHLRRRVQGSDRGRLRDHRRRRARRRGHLRRRHHDGSHSATSPQPATTSSPRRRSWSPASTRQSTRPSACWHRRPRWKRHGQRTQRTGYLDGADMARVFAWLRPNDLVWNYWVNNYLLGQNPPPFDILFWNADTTRLPAGLHSDFLDLFTSNGLAEATTTVLGTPTDLQAMDIDTYVVAGSTDHIVPWRAAYRTTQLTGGDTDFVLSSSGHIQAMVNPPGNPKSSYRTANGTPPADADEWLAATDGAAAPGGTTGSSGCRSARRAASGLRQRRAAAHRTRRWNPRPAATSTSRDRVIRRAAPHLRPGRRPPAAASRCEARAVHCCW